MVVQKDGMMSSSELLWREGGQMAWKLVRIYHEGQKKIAFIELQVSKCTGLNNVLPEFMPQNL